jgi:hypothetical protein
MTEAGREIVRRRIWCEQPMLPPVQHRAKPAAAVRSCDIWGWRSHPAFGARVVDALIRLRRGETPAEIRELHGLIVLRTAMESRERATK